MNLFFLSGDPVQCAEWHADKHVVKMVLETAQLLSSAHRVLDGLDHTVAADGTRAAARKGTLPDERERTLYKITHANHPCAKWVRASSGNYAWAFQLFVALCDEYTFRYKKTHACERLMRALATPPTGIQRGEMTPPAQAMPDTYKGDDPVAAYRAYYTHDKKHLFAWKGRKAPPPWLITPQ